MSPHNMLGSEICLIKLLRDINQHKENQAECFYIRSSAESCLFFHNRSKHRALDHSRFRVKCLISTAAKHCQPPVYSPRGLLFQITCGLDWTGEMSSYSLS